jgi:hypothetical protein
MFTRGYEVLVKVMEGDLEVGVKMLPKEVISSKNVAVIECDIENPPASPTPALPPSLKLPVTATARSTACTGIFRQKRHAMKL